MKTPAEDVRVDSLNLREILQVPSDTPIRDSRVGKHIEVIEHDCKLRVRPKNKTMQDMFDTALGCAGSQAHFRTYKTLSLMFSQIAYCVEHDADGKLVIKRYSIPSETRNKLIALNDNPKTEPHAGGFDLTPIRKGARVEIRRRYDKQRKALMSAGKWKPNLSRSHPKQPGRPASNRPTWLRSGAGLVHL